MLPYISILEDLYMQRALIYEYRGQRCLQRDFYKCTLVITLCYLNSLWILFYMKGFLVWKCLFSCIILDIYNQNYVFTPHQCHTVCSRSHDTISIVNYIKKLVQTSWTYSITGPNLKPLHIFFTIHYILCISRNRSQNCHPMSFIASLLHQNCHFKSLARCFGIPYFFFRTE